MNYDNSQKHKQKNYFLMILGVAILTLSTIFILQVTNGLKAKDVLAPSVSLNGDNTVNLLVDEEYIENSVKAFDNKDGDISNKVETSGIVDTSKEGIYTVNYVVEDRAGNKTVKKRTVIVQSVASPVVIIKPNGSEILNKSYSIDVQIIPPEGNSISISKYQWTKSKTEPSVNSFKENITGKISSPKNVTGSYYLWIYAKDNKGNTKIINSNVFKIGEQKVTIKDKTPPTVTFTPNGNATASLSQSTKIVLNDVSGIKLAKYIWSKSSSIPNVNSMPNIIKGVTATITLSNETGNYYLWVYVEDKNGNSTIVSSNAFAVQKQKAIISAEEVENVTYQTGLKNIKIFPTNASSYSDKVPSKSIDAIPKYYNSNKTAKSIPDSISTGLIITKKASCAANRNCIKISNVYVTSCVKYDFSKVYSTPLTVRYRQASIEEKDYNYTCTGNNCKTSPGVRLFTSVNGTNWNYYNGDQPYSWKTTGVTTDADGAYKTYTLTPKNNYRYVLICRGPGNDTRANVYINSVSTSINTSISGFFLTTFNEYTNKDNVKKLLKNLHSIGSDKYIVYMVKNISNNYKESYDKYLNPMFEAITELGYDTKVIVSIAKGNNNAFKKPIEKDIPNDAQLASAKNVADYIFKKWGSNSLFFGWYIKPELRISNALTLDINNKDQYNYIKLASYLKSLSKEKKVVISPWYGVNAVSDNATAQFAKFAQFFSGYVDIIALQDGAGGQCWGKTQLDKEFKAAQEINKYGIELWANVENWRDVPCGSNVTKPINTSAKIADLVDQIKVASKYTSNIISWAYIYMDSNVQVSETSKLTVNIRGTLFNNYKKYYTTLH